MKLLWEVQFVIGARDLVNHQRHQLTDRHPATDRHTHKRVRSVKCEDRANVYV